MNTPQPLYVPESYDHKNAVAGWSYSLHRFIHKSYNEVYQAWGTRGIRFHSDPQESKAYPSGSRDNTPIYATRRDAYDALLIEFEAWVIGKRAEIEKERGL